MNFFLASTSPRRRELLNSLGIAHELINININEERRNNETPLNYVERMAKEKVEAGFSALADTGQALVLAADTMVMLGDRVLGKPQDRQQAREMLLSLSGRSHVVITSFALKSADKIRIQRVHTTVFFRHILDAELDWYLNTGEPQDKAGSYAIQGAGGVFVNSISGSYSSVVGLPLSELIVALRDFGLDFTAISSHVPAAGSQLSV